MLIVIFHLYGYTGKGAGSQVYAFCQNVQIVIFIYLSGLLYVGKVHKSIKDKAIRLRVPFFSFYIIWGLIDIKNFIEFPLDEFKFGYWFVLVLFAIIAIYTLIERLTSKYGLRHLHLIFYTFLTAYELLIPKGCSFNMLFSINMLWHYYPFFILGTYNNKMQKWMSINYIPIFLVVFIISQYVYTVYDKRSIAPICNISSLFLFLTSFKNNIRPFEIVFTKMGEYSMQIYLLHFLILELIYKHISILSITNSYILFILYLVLAFIIAFGIIAISMLLMKSKLLNLLLFGIRTK